MVGLLQNLHKCVFGRFIVRIPANPENTVSTDHARLDLGVSVHFDAGGVGVQVAVAVDEFDQFLQEITRHGVLAGRVVALVPQLQAVEGLSDIKAILD